MQGSLNVSGRRADLLTPRQGWGLRPGAGPHVCVHISTHPTGCATCWILIQSFQEHSRCSLTSAFFLLSQPSLLRPSWLFTPSQTPLSHPIHHGARFPLGEIFSSLCPRCPAAPAACLPLHSLQHILPRCQAPVIAPFTFPRQQGWGPRHQKSLRLCTLTQGPCHSRC